MIVLHNYTGGKRIALNKIDRVEEINNDTTLVRCGKSTYTVKERFVTVMKYINNEQRESKRTNK